MATIKTTMDIRSFDTIKDKKYPLVLLAGPNRLFPLPFTLKITFLSILFPNRTECNSRNKQEKDEMPRSQFLRYRYDRFKTLT